MSDKITDRRTCRTPNEIVMYDDYAEIILYNRHNIEIERAIIDLNDIENVSKYKWNFARGYVRNIKESTMLHHLVMGGKPDKPFVIDHINRNRLDNRKHNLRITDYTLNGFNKGRQSNNTSGHVGVSWEKSRNKWESHIKKHGKKKFLGYFDKLEDAIKRREEAEIEFYETLRNKEFDSNTVFKNPN